ncbi:hypothetical protein TEHAB4_19080 [Tetragenococcus halophilus]|uniref:ATP-binding protein n=1 Tax=Tetragenococcus halophilus TaxID=51669 RepID=UPI002568EAEC|nr:ATP-binding protein [Tetragenococcus halophilus]GMG62161.1 hypothetical protein TEHAB4_19080 [Tetragenococcus halophilus]
MFQVLVNNLKCKVVACTFVCEENKLWLLKDEQLEEITFNYLSSLIDDDYSYENVLDKTELSDLVISPYSEPRRFNHHCYYLSDEQVRVKEVILRNDKKKFGIIGGPGTGKSMLLFDIGKKYKGEDKKVLIIFCAQLEESEQLTDEFDMKIISIRDISINYSIRQSADKFLNSFDVILVDEAQRLLESQYNTLMSLVDKKIIFSTDHQQTLHESEKDSNIEYKLCHSSQVKELVLKNKIRTDIEMSSFIQKFLDLKSNVEPYGYKNVHIVYFKDSKSACEYIESMERNNDFTPIELTEYIDKFATGKKRQKIYPNSISCHEVIGKEYNNVLVPLDSYFSYSNDYKLFSLYTNYCGYYPYFEDSEIFEALTRVKKKLLLVIIDNVKLYRVLQSILTWEEDILTASPNYVYEKNYSTWEEAYDHLEIEKDNKEMYASKMELNGKNGQVKISYYPKNL